MLCYLVSMVTSTELFRLGVPMSYASTVTRLFPCTYKINIMNIILIVILITIIIYINIITLTNTLTVIHENYRNYSDHHNSTWSYENRVSKHFVIFLNFRCLIACLLCCLLMSFVFLACLVVRDLCRSGCRQNYYLTPQPPPPPPHFFPYPQFFL